MKKNKEERKLESKWTAWSERGSPALAQLSTINPSRLLDWSIHISLDYKFVYFDNPKVASGTIKTRLAQYASSDTGLTDIFPHNRFDLPFKSPANLTEDQLMEALFSNKYFRFCFVRNPYTRILSAFLDKFNADRLLERYQVIDKLRENLRMEVEKYIYYRKCCLEYLNRDPKDWHSNIMFDEFVEWVGEQDWYDCDMHWRRQHDNLLIEEINHSYIGRFENFENDMSEILNHIFLIQHAPEVKQNQVSHATRAEENLKTYYTPKVFKRVEEIFAIDFQSFDYDASPPIW